jgi:hypothetical protein
MGWTRRLVFALAFFLIAIPAVAQCLSFSVPSWVSDPFTSSGPASPYDGLVGECRRRHRDDSTFCPQIEQLFHAWQTQQSLLLEIKSLGQKVDRVDASVGDLNSCAKPFVMNWSWSLRLAVALYCVVTACLKQSSGKDVRSLMTRAASHAVLFGFLWMGVHVPLPHLAELWYRSQKWAVEDMILNTMMTSIVATWLTNNPLVYKALLHSLPEMIRTCVRCCRSTATFVHDTATAPTDETGHLVPSEPPRTEGDAAPMDAAAMVSDPASAPDVSETDPASAPDVSETDTAPQSEEGQVADTGFDLYRAVFSSGLASVSSTIPPPAPVVLLCEPTARRTRSRRVLAVTPGGPTIDG